MARFVKNTQNLPMKYMFEVTMHAVELHVPYKVQVICVIKRGSRRLETTRDCGVASGEPIADFQDEKMTMMTTVYKDKATKSFQERVVSIIKHYFKLY